MTKQFISNWLISFLINLFSSFISGWSLSSSRTSSSSPMSPWPSWIIDGDSGAKRAPSNQTFEGAKFTTIGNASSIFLLTLNFLFSIMSYHKFHCQWSIKHAHPSFGQRRKIYGTKNKHLLCCSEPGYLTSERDISYVRYLGWLG